MRTYNTNEQKHHLTVLPFFPAPYPGESFYSILCRYHARSGNLSSSYTILQLFGRKRELTSTLIAPFHMEMLRHWVPACSGITWKKMLLQNTAYNVYALTAKPREIENILSVLSEKKPASSFPHGILPKLVNQSRHLRYCPQCVASQIQLYGEAYWQVIPQIDDVEYCPIHKIRIKNSPVSLNNINSNFYPASVVLKTNNLITCSEEYIPTWESLYKKEEKFFIKLSQNINWLLQNGEKFSGFDRLRASYIDNNLMDKISNNSWLEISCTKIRDLFKAISPSGDLYHYLESKNPRQLYTGANYVFTLRVTSHVMIMTARSGHPSSFYDSKHV